MILIILESCKDDETCWDTEVENYGSRGLITNRILKKIKRQYLIIEYDSFFYSFLIFLSDIDINIHPEKSDREVMFLDIKAILNMH